MAKDFFDKSSSKYEVPPGTRMSNRDIATMQQRRYQENLAAQNQPATSAGSAPKIAGYASTGIPGKIETLYADQNMNNVSPYTTNAQISELARGDARTANAYTKHRDNMWDNQNDTFEQDVNRQKLGMGDLALQRGQIANERARENLIAEQNRNMAAEFLMPVSHAKAQEELRALENKNILSENEISRQQYYQNLLDKPEAQTQQRSPAAVASDVMQAESINDAGPAWDSLKSLTASYNVPPETLNRLYTGRLAITYDTPMEMVQDVGIKVPAGNIVSINALDKPTTALVDTAIANNLPPDRALKQVLTDIGADKANKDYSQKAVDIAYAIKKRYMEAGESALQDTQAAIAANNQRQFAAASSLMAPLPEQVSTPEGAFAIIDSVQKSMQDLVTASQSAGIGGTKTAPYAPALLQKAYGQVGIDPMAAATMQPEQIRQLVMLHLVTENEGDPQFTEWMQDQINKPPTQREPRLQGLLDSVVTPFNKGYAQARQAEIKQQADQSKVVSDNLQKGLFTEWNEAGKPITFKTQEAAKAYSEAPTAEKYAIESHEREMQERAIAGSIGNEYFQTIEVKEQSKIRSELEIAKAYLNMGSMDNESLKNIPSMKEKGITDMIQLREWAENTANVYGLSVDLPQIAEPETKQRWWDELRGWLKDDETQTVTPTAQPQPQGQTQPTAQVNIPTATTRTEVMALPPGTTQFIDGQGVIRDIPESMRNTVEGR